MNVFYITNNSIDNFKQVGQIIYAGVEDKILSEEELKEQNKVELYKDTTIFESESPFIGYPIRQDNTIRPATRLELINMGYQSLEDGEYIEGQEIKKIERPSWQHKWVLDLKKWIPDETKLYDGQYIEGEEIKQVERPIDMLNPKWNKESHIWEEQATENEINLHSAKEQYKEYVVLDTPLNFEKMEEQGILVEYKTMMNELESIIETLTANIVSKVSGFSAVVIPKPSKNLIDFKNKFNKLF